MVSKKMKMILGLVVLAMALLTVAPPAWSQEVPALPAFGIRPARAPTTEGAAFFSYTLSPGDSIRDEALIVNMGQSPMALKLYAADGVTAINGGASFTESGQQRRGVFKWLSTEMTATELAAGERVVVPFTLQVPPDAPPGDHVAGWVVEAPPKPGGENLAVAILERVGVAVVIRVPGATNQDLVLSTLCLNQESGSNYFQVGVANKGNVLTRGTGTFTLTRSDGAEAFARPVELGAVIPGDDTFLRVDAPLEPPPGRYQALLVVRQPNGAEEQLNMPVEIPSEKVNGCAPAVSPEEKGPQPTLPPLPGGGGWPWLLMIPLLLLLLLLLLLAEYLRRRSRRAARYL